MINNGRVEPGDVCMKQKNERMVIDINAVKSRKLVVRDQQVLIDRDVAALSGVQIEEVNQAIRNNTDEFSDGFLFRLAADEKSELLKQATYTPGLDPLRQRVLCQISFAG